MTATTSLNNVARAQDVTPTVMLMQHPTYGLILTDSSGFTLYTWEADEPLMSNCYDACADEWPPLIVSDQLIIPTGLPGALDLVDRGDGTWQVALDGWPLYYFWADTQAGDVKGDGDLGFGARWDVVASHRRLSRWSRFRPRQSPRFPPRSRPWPSRRRRSSTRRQPRRSRPSPGPRT